MKYKRTMKSTKIATLTAIFLTLTSCVKQYPGKVLSPGETIPDFTVTTNDHRRLNTADLLGKPSAIIFFDTTCPDCHKQLPELERIWTNHNERLNVLAIARNEEKVQVSSYWSASGYTMPVAAPGDRSVYDLFDRGSRSGVPLTFVADPKGTLLLVSDDTKVLSSQEILSITFDSKNR